MSQALMDILPSLTKGIISMFIILDPFGNIPIFIGLTEKMEKSQRKKMLYTANLTRFVLLVSFALAGQQMFSFFGITMHSFIIACGILLIIISIRILIARGWEEHAVSPESMGAVPIAIPLLPGPGAIATTILNINALGVPATTASVVVVFAVV